MTGKKKNQCVRLCSVGMGASAVGGFMGELLG